MPFEKTLRPQIFLSQVAFLELDFTVGCRAQRVGHKRAQKAQMIKNIKDYIYPKNSFVLSVPLCGVQDDF